MLAGRGVGPLAGDAGGRQADEERAPAGAANVAGGPVASMLAAVREVTAADLFGARTESGGDGGGVHGAPPARMTAPAKPGRRTGSESMGAPRSRLPGGRPVPAPLRLLPVPGGRAMREARAVPSGRGRLGTGCTKKAGAAQGGTRHRPGSAGGRSPLSHSVKREFRHHPPDRRCRTRGRRSPHRWQAGRRCRWCRPACRVGTAHCCTIPP